MRPFILLLSMAAAQLLSAQDCAPVVETVATLPEDGSVAVPLRATISFTFNCDIDADAAAYLAYHMDGEFALGGEPDLGQGRVEADARTLSYDVIHLPDEDYLWIVQGGYLADPHLPARTFFLAYTTAESRGPRTLSGTVLDPAQSAGKVLELPVFHVSERAVPPQLRVFDRPHAPGPDAEPRDAATVRSVDSDEETIIYLYRGEWLDLGSGIAAGAIADPETGRFSLPGLHDGMYFPVVTRCPIGYCEETSPLAFHDADGDGRPDGLRIEGGDVSEVFLQLYPAERFRLGAKDAVDILRETYRREYGEPEALMGISGFDRSFDGAALHWSAEFSSGTQFVSVVLSRAFSYRYRDPYVPQKPYRPLPDGWIDSFAMVEALLGDVETGPFFERVAAETSYLDFEAGDVSVDDWDPPFPDPEGQYWSVRWVGSTEDGGRPRFMGHVELVDGTVTISELFEPLPAGTARAYDAFARGLVEQEYSIPAEDLMLISADGHSGADDGVLGVSAQWQFYYSAPGPTFWGVQLYPSYHGVYGGARPAVDSYPNAPEGWVDSDALIERALDAGGTEIVATGSLSGIRWRGGFVDDDRYPTQREVAIWEVTFQLQDGRSLALAFDMETLELLRETQFTPLAPSVSAPFLARALEIASEVAPDPASLTTVMLSAWGVSIAADSLRNGISAEWQVELWDGERLFSVDLSPSSERLDVAIVVPDDVGPAVPDSYVESDSAMAIAHRAGASSFLEAYPNGSAALLGGSNFESRTRFPQWTDRALWVIDFDRYYEQSLTVVLDMGSGEVLKTDRKGPATAENAERRAFELIAEQLGLTEGLTLFQLTTDDLDLDTCEATEWTYNYLHPTAGRVEARSVGSAWESVSSYAEYQHPDGAPMIPESHLSSTEACARIGSHEDLMQFRATQTVDYVLFNGGMPQGWGFAPGDRPVWEAQILGTRRWPDPPPAQLIAMDMVTGEILNSVYVGREQDDQNPSSFKLGHAFPNPFTNQVRIPYSMPKAGPVRATVFDMLGRRVAVLTEGLQTAGAGEVVWAPMGVAAGVYMIQFVAFDSIHTALVVKSR